MQELKRSCGSVYNGETKKKIISRSTDKHLWKCCNFIICDELSNLPGIFLSKNCPNLSKTNFPRIWKPVN